MTSTSAAERPAGPAGRAARSEKRATPPTAGRRRTFRARHALTILAADAAFTYAGAKLSDEAEQSFEKRRQHRTVALSAMGLTVASGIAMKLWNR